MRAEDFTEKAPGRFVGISPLGRAFIPAPLPRTLELSPSTRRLLGDARCALGKLEMGVSGFPSGDALVRPFQVNEAVLSSRIEGTRTTLPEALADRVARLTRFANNDARAIANYDDALQLGLRAVEGDGPINLALLRELKHRLLSGDPDSDRSLGAFRTHQVVIGADADTPEEKIAISRFIPPPPEHLQECLDALSAYLSDPSSDDPLVRIALTHYQFEAIHPFGDGNGRVGRMLIALQMVRERAISRPWLYVSPEIERARQKYIDALYRVSTTGAYEEWVCFFLNMVLLSVDATLSKLKELDALRANVEARLVGYKSPNGLRLVPLLFSWPVISYKDAEEHLACTYATARHAVREMVSRNILQPLDMGTRYGKVGRPPEMFWSEEIVTVLTRREPLPPLPGK